MSARGRPALGLALLLAACATTGGWPYDFREKRLANGLRVLTVERRASPVVAVQVWYHSGLEGRET